MGREIPDSQSTRALAQNGLSENDTNPVARPGWFEQQPDMEDFWAQIGPDLDRLPEAARDRVPDFDSFGSGPRPNAPADDFGALTPSDEFAPSGDGPGSVEWQNIPEQTDTIRLIEDAVEYYWQVGCTPTALAIVLGYWDRNGYDNLIEGDTTYFSQAIRDAISGPEHYANYYYEWDTFGPDASTLGGAHIDTYIADFAHTSREFLGLADGWSKYSWEGLGIHGYAASRGYDNFRTEHEAWGGFGFGDIQTEIDAGRPVILAVDSDGDGRNDHNVVVFGYNSETQDLLIHDGWDSTTDMRWIEWLPRTEGHRFGITSATFVRPQENEARQGEDQYLTLINDGSGWAASAYADMSTSGVFDIEVLDSESFLSRANLTLASHNGHDFFTLWNDGSGSVSIYKAMNNGSGELRAYLGNADSGLGSATLGFATADGQTFYQLLDDNSGTVALYQSVLQDDWTFDWTLLTSESGFSDRVIDLSTSDGETFTVLYDDGFGTAATYSATLQDGGFGGFDITLLTSESGLSRDTVGLAEWEGNEYIPPPPPVLATVLEDDGVVIFGLDDRGNYAIEIDGILLTLTEDGVPVSPDTYAGWSAIHAETSGDGIVVLWEGYGRTEYYWEVDAAGNLLAERRNTDLAEVEVLFETDLNRDGTIGVVRPDGEVAPVAEDDTSDPVLVSALAEGAKINGTNVLRNDSDANGDSLSITQINGVAITASGWQGWLDASNGGQIALNTDGRVQFRDPDGDFNTLALGDQSETSITYTISDGNGGTSEGTITFVIEGEAEVGPNVAPVAEDDVNAALAVSNLTDDSGNALKINGTNVLLNDSDANGDTLDIIAIDGVAVTDNGWQGWRDASNGGQIVLNTDGRVQFRDTGFDFADLAGGESVETSLIYTVSDGNGGTDTATVSFTFFEDDLLVLDIDGGDTIV